jgi:cytochrome c-type biogenesis protein CcmE
MATVNAAGQWDRQSLPGVVAGTHRSRARGWSRSRLLVGAGAAALVMVFFVSSALQSGAVYYMTVAELAAKGPAAFGERVRVAAKVVDGTILREGGVLLFAVADDPSVVTTPRPAGAGLLERLFGWVAPATSAAPGPAAGVVAALPGAQQLRVSYRGVVPDVFGPDIEVVVEGKLTPAGVFEASTLLAKCPSRYDSSTTPQP